MTILSKQKIFFSAYILFLSTLFILIFTILAVTSPGCKSDENVINSAADNNVSVGFYSENAAGDNTLVITEAKFLVRKLMLKHDHGEECDVNLGPFVVYLDMVQKVVVVGIAKIPAGDYDDIMFQVHKPSPNENIADPEFIESNSRRFSVIAKGFYNTVSFVFKSDVTVAKEIDFENPPVSIGSVTFINITIRLNPYSWFINNGIILDPMNEDNKNVIKQNIKNSLRWAFKDIDLNGEPD